MTESRKEQKQTGALFNIYEWVDAIVIALVFVVTLFTFILGIVGVSGPSMQNTIQSGDKVIISNLFYTPQHGDIVVISRNYANDPAALTNSDGNDSSPIIKRVIGLPGDKIRIDSEKGVVYRNDVALKEPYTFAPNDTIKAQGNPSYDFSGDVPVPPGHIFVMGDHREVSMDSRYKQIGMVDERYVLGKAIYRIFPINSFGSLYKNT